jgi:dTDP-4-amino-4,6-dideoxygalactose transaminase
MNVPKWPVSTEREIELLREVLESDKWGGYHPFVAQLEQEFAKFQHSAHALAAVNGTVTLEMALEALGIGPGDEVIVPAITFVATASAVSRVGATPVFVDLEDDTFNIDPACAERAISKATKAIMAVHFGGPMADMDRLCRIATNHGLHLIEDAAHAAGSEWKGRRAGSIGIAGSFSFQNSKVMTAGEGGIFTTSDPVLFDRAFSILDLGRKPGGGWFVHYETGTNYRITGLQAAVLLAQLERLPEQNCRRERNARIIRESVPGIRFQRVPAEARVHTNYLLLGRIQNRDAFQSAVISQGLPCTFYPHTLYQNPVYLRGGCRVMPCPVAEACVRDAFWLPHRALLGSEDDANEIAAILRSAAQ